MNRRVFLGVTAGCPLGLAGCVSHREPVNGDKETGIEENPTSVNGNEETAIEEDPRIDEPPHPIDQETAEKYDGHEEAQEKWNEEYLGEQMSTEPSLKFERVDIPTGLVTNDKFGLGRVESSDDAYRVDVVEEESEAEAIFMKSDMDEEQRQTLESVNFGASSLLLVETGLGSGTIEHRWSRVEEAENSVHLHGYYTSHYEQTDDLATRFSVLEVERPNGVEFARVSLTVDVNRRVHFNSTEGIVTV